MFLFTRVYVIQLNRGTDTIVELIFNNFISNPTTNQVGFTTFFVMELNNFIIKQHLGGRRKNDKFSRGTPFGKNFRSRRRTDEQVRQNQMEHICNPFVYI